MRLIEIELPDGRRARVKFGDYVRAKTKDLKEFGYNDLTQKEVREQLDLLLSGKKWTNVIGGFIEQDKPKEPQP